jgi:hypothetical protein
MNTVTSALAQLNNATDSTPSATAPRRHKDPILQELWAVKAQMNLDAGYDVRRLYTQVQQAAAVLFDSNGRVRNPVN